MTLPDTARAVLAPLLVVGAVCVLRGPSAAHRLLGVTGRPGSRDRSAAGAPHLLLRLGALLRGRAVRRRGDDALVAAALAEAWAARLRAGRPVDRALGEAIAEIPGSATLLPSAARAVAVEGEVGGALRRDARSLGDCPAGRGVAAASACWEVAHVNGGRLAAALERVGDSLRAEADHRAHVRAQLAGPRATARLLAALPVLALGMSSGLGLHPAHMLVDDPVGRIALAAGVVLDLLGLWWTSRIARSAERTA